jgi:hypothetical protein
LNDVRIHDLRHSFGMSLPMIGKLLGHSQPVTTARYAHLAVDPIRAASNLIGAEIDTAMNSRKPARKRLHIRSSPAVQPPKRARAGASLIMPRTCQGHVKAPIKIIFCALFQSLRSTEGPKIG